MRIARNEPLREARQGAGLTQAQLADLANAQVEAVTGRLGAMDADYIGKLERGVHRWPHQSYRAALRVVLDVATDRDLGFFSTRSRPDTVASVPRHAEGGDDVERKAFLRVLAGSVVGVALTDPLASFTARASAGGTRRIGQAEVDHVRHLARMFASQDHQYGGGLSARAVVAQLSASAELTEGTFTGTRVRDGLFTAVAELADTAAGLCFDAGLHREAERAFRFSVGCATESGDWDMRAKALSGLANLSVHRGRAEDALSFAEMALVRADRLSSKVGAVVRTRHARALALAGASRGVDCHAAIGQAGELFAASSGDEPAWLAYYDEAHLERDCGRALVHLALNGGEHGEARDRLTTSIARFPAGHSRGKALAKANLAALMMARDDPRHAVDLGHDAVESVGAVRSDRVNDALRQLVAAGRPHAHLPEVRELLHRVRLAVD